MTAAIDPLGRCVAHPFVQLKRQSRRTGEWKFLLDTCPLCAMDESVGVTDSVAVPILVAFKKEEDEVVPAKTAPLPLNQRIEHENPRDEEDGEKRDGRPQRSNVGGSHIQRSRSNGRAPDTVQGPRPKGASCDSRRSYQPSRLERNDSSFERRQKSRYRRGEPSGGSGRGSSNPARARNGDCLTDKSRDLRPQDASLDSRRSRRSQSIRRSLHPNPRGAQGKKSRSLSAGISASRRAIQDLMQMKQSGSTNSSFGKSCDLLSQDASVDSRRSHRSHVSRRSLQLTSHDSRRKTRRSLSAGISSSRRAIQDLMLKTQSGDRSRRPEGSLPRAGGSGVIQGSRMQLSSGIPNPGRQAESSRSPSGNLLSSPVVTGLVPSKPESRSADRAAAEDRSSDKGKQGEGRNQRDNASWVGPIINTAIFDCRGCCVRHPHVTLQKKKLLGGWRVLMSECPYCVGELKRMRFIEEDKRRIREMKERNEREERDRIEKLRRKRPSLDASGGTASLTGSSIGSLLTPSTDDRTAETAPIAQEKKDRSEQSEEPNLERWEQTLQTDTRGTIRVRGMRWVDPEDGRAGTYTGDANDRLIPHGHGAMEYEGGGMREGGWDDGQYLSHGGGVVEGDGSIPGLSPHPGAGGRGGRNPPYIHRRSTVAGQPWGDIAGLQGLGRLVEPRPQRRRTLDVIR